MATHGEVAVLWSTAEGGALRLGNFAIGKFDLKSEHLAALFRYVFPFLVAGGSATVVGLTSRSGSNSFNLKLSRDRADAVIRILRLRVGIAPVVLSQLPLGEIGAVLAGVPNGNEHPNWRSVIVLYSKSPKHPTLPKTFFRQPTTVTRFSSKRVLLPIRSKAGFDERGSTAALIGQFVANIANPDSQVIPEKMVRVSDTYTVTQINIAFESGGIAFSPTSVDYEVLRFDWGPSKDSVEIWSDASGVFPRALKETVSQARAMEIYEHPGHYVFRPHRE